MNCPKPEDWRASEDDPTLRLEILKHVETCPACFAKEVELEQLIKSAERAGDDWMTGKLEPVPEWLKKKIEDMWKKNLQ